MKLKIVTVMASILLLQTCATPTVVETRKVNDNQLSCSQIQSEIEEAKGFEQKARKVLGMLKRGIKFTPTKPDIQKIYERLQQDLPATHL